MLSRRLRSALVVLTASVSLAGCAGVYGSPYGSGVSVGYGTGYGAYGGYGDPYYGSGYGDPYYGRYGYPYYGSGYGSGYGYGYRQPYYGWYDGYYYPGTGYYVYDRSGVRQRWTETQKRYWESRGPGVTVVNRDGSSAQPQSVTRQRIFSRSVQADRPRLEERQSVRAERQGIRQATREERQQVRQARREAREEKRDQD